MPVNRIHKPIVKKNGPIFKPGYWVAVTLKEKVAPTDCYVGEIQAVDEHGIRITLVDWLIGAASGSDLYIAWEQIAVALVATEDHSLEYFVTMAGDWQSLVYERQREATSTKSQEEGK